MLNKKNWALTIALTLIWTQTTVASEMDDSIHWNGFISAVAAISDTETTYLEDINKNGGVRDYRLGLSMSKQLGEGWSAAALLIAHEGEEQIVLHWGLVNYQVNDNVKIALGKQKFMNSIVSEYYHVGYAYPWIRPPQEFYSIQSLGPNMSIDAINGASVSLRTTSNNIEYAIQPFMGISDLPAESGQLKKVMGVKASAGSEAFTVQAAYFQGMLQIPDSPDRAMLDGEDLKTWTLGSTLNWKNLTGYLEYGQSSISKFSEFDTDAGYATLGYKIGKFLPYVTYAQFEQDSGLAQKSNYLGLRREVNSFTSIKIEWQGITPTQRNTPLPSGAQPAGLFGSMPNESAVNMLSLGVDLTF